MTVFLVKKDRNYVKTRELSIGKQRAILKVRKNMKINMIIENTFGIANTDIWNIVERKEVTGASNNKEQFGQGKTADDRNIVSALKQTPEKRVIYIINILHSAMVEVSQFTVQS